MRSHCLAPAPAGHSFAFTQIQNSCKFLLYPAQASILILFLVFLPSVFGQTSSTSTSPAAQLSAAPVSGTAPLAVTFTASGSTQGSAAITSLGLSFGDGTANLNWSDRTQTQSHTFAVAGSFTTRLTVTDANGGSAAVSTTIMVTAPPATCSDSDLCFDFEAAPNTLFDCIDFPCTPDQNQVRFQSGGRIITGFSQNHADPFPPGDRAADSSRLALVDGGRNGGKAIQLTTLDNDSNVHSSGSMERSEILLTQTDTGAVEGADTWWAHSLLIPANSTLPSTTDTQAGILQFHGSGGGAPNFFLSIVNQTGNTPHKVFRAYTAGNGGLDSAGTQYNYTVDGNPRIGQCISDDFQQGVWYDFVHHIKWSSNGTGRHEIWMRKGNGPVTKVLDKSGISTLFAGDSAYLKFGVYHDPVLGANTSVIHDRIRRSSSADAVRLPDFNIDPNAGVTPCAGVTP